MNRAANLLLAALVVAAALLAAGAVPAAAQAEPDYVVTDPQGDVFVLFVPPPAPLVPLPVTNPFDVTRIGILGEDEVGLHFFLEVVNFRGDPSPILFGDDARYHFQAKLDGSSTTYAITWFPPLPGPTDDPKGVQPVAAQFCLEQEEPQGGAPGGFGGGCNEQRVEATIDWDKNRLDAYVTKNALMGREAAGGGVSAGSSVPPITRTSRLVDIFGAFERFFPTPMSDRAPDSGGAPEPYTFRFDSANLKIRLSLPSDEIVVETDGRGGDVGGGGELPLGAPAPVREIGVTPGDPYVLPVKLTNTNAAKRIVNLTASLADAGLASEWKVQIAPSVQVPGGDDRVVNLIVNASESVEHRDAAVVYVQGRSLGYPDEIAALRLNFVASASPGADRSTLYFHAASREQGVPADDVLCGMPFFCRGPETWTNTLRDDPNADMDDAADFETSFFGPSLGYELEFGLDAPIDRALVLDPAKPIEATLGFTSDLEVPADVALDVVTAKTRTVVGAGSANANVKTGTPVTLSFVPLANAQRIAADEGGVVIRVRLEVSLAGPGAASLSPNFKFVPKASQVVFPFIEDPQKRLAPLGAGPAVLTIQPRDTDAEEFLNPGRTRIFNATLLNEGLEATEAQLSALWGVELPGDAPEWRVQIRPGARYQLAPGDGAKFAVLVRAPPDAKEGAQLQVLVNATSPSDPSVLAQILFKATVITGIDVPDEAGLYEDDPDSAGKVVVGSRHESPGFEGLGAALAVAAALGAALRRRRAG